MSGAHIEAENVERDLPKAVALAHKAGLETPMVITAIVDAKSARVEAILEHDARTRYSLLPRAELPLRLFAELEPQLEALKPRIASLAKLNEKYGDHRDVSHALGDRERWRRCVGSLVGAQALRSRSLSV